MNPMNPSNPSNPKIPMNPIFRLDRLLTLYFFYPLIRATSTHKGIKIPILMYHSISNDNESNVHPYYRINTTPDIFDMHMKFLYKNNYKAIGLEQAAKILKSPDIKFPDHRINNGNRQTQVIQETQVTQQTMAPNKPSKEKFVVITFDDGYQDFYNEAFQILKKYNYTATVFLPTGFIGNREGLKGKKHLNWDEIMDLSDDGISFGSHTVNHPQLKYLEKEDIEFEIRKSKEVVENNLGKPVEFFSYPFAFPDEDKNFTKYLKETLEKWGYKCGVSTRIGIASTKDDIYFIKRIPLNSYDDILFFQAKIRGGYDWLAYPQSYKKNIKAKQIKRFFR